MSTDPRSRAANRPVVTQGRRPGGRRYFTLDRHSEGFETAWVAIVVGAILFSIVLGPLSPVILTLSLPAFAVLRWERIPRVLSDSWPLLLLPGFAIVSVLWSQVPGTTARYAFLYLITVLVGIVMGGAYRGNA